MITSLSKKYCYEEIISYAKHYGKAEGRRLIFALKPENFVGTKEEFELLLKIMNEVDEI